METMLAIATAGLCLVVMIEVTSAAIANLLRHAMLQDANCDICRRARREQLENPVAGCSRNVDRSPQSPQTSRFRDMTRISRRIDDYQPYTRHRFCSATPAPSQSRRAWKRPGRCVRR